MMDFRYVFLMGNFWPIKMYAIAKSSFIISEIVPTVIRKETLGGPICSDRNMLFNSLRNGEVIIADATVAKTQNRTALLNSLQFTIINLLA
jgi:hypothetical protein